MYSDDAPQWRTFPADEPQESQYVVIDRDGCCQMAHFTKTDPIDLSERCGARKGDPLWIIDGNPARVFEGDRWIPLPKPLSETPWQRRERMEREDEKRRAEFERYWKDSWDALEV